MGVLKKFIIAFLTSCCLWAMPAVDRLHQASLPDGSTISLRSVGNEALNYKLTEDGYPVARDSSGYFCYMDESGSLTHVRARDVQERTGSEIEFLSALNRDGAVKFLEGRRHKREYAYFKKYGSESITADTTRSSTQMLRMPKADANLNGGERKALVILVQFRDVKFVDSDPQAVYDQMLNGESYNENGNIGSVRDYFKANSGGKFIPDFDVVGPVTLPGMAYRDYGEYSRYGSEGARVALSMALDSLKARGTVDFKQYDNDSDQILDFVHMIYAGFGSNDSDQDSAMWPHAWDMRSPGEYTNAGLKTVVSSRNFFGKSYYVGPYACSNELDGMAFNYGKRMKTGVGSFVHEFSHLLGLGDHYVTQGESVYALGTWDVMDGGAYNCPFQDYPVSCAPPYYSAFERMYLGWMKATEIKAGKGIQLLPISENVALKVTNPKNPDEFYLLEYRNRGGWDVGLHNHGMLIWHIDYNDTAWYYANINSSERMHVGLVEADGKADPMTTTSDVFPGTGWGKRYTSFNQFITWDGTELGVSLTDIAEASTYEYVSFDVNGENDFVESSSSAVEGSSSSGAASSSGGGESSCSGVAGSSSSADGTSTDGNSSESARSSSSVEIASPDPAEFLKKVSVADMKVSRGETFRIFGMPRGEKTLRVFSLNGNLLLSRNIAGSDFSLEVSRRFGNMPVVIQLSHGHRVILNVLNKLQ